MATRGRKPMEPAINSTEVHEELISADLAQIDQLPALEARIQENALALAKELAYDGALTVESLEEEIKFYQRRSVEAVLEMGKRLLLLKEVTGHGGFIESIDRLSIDYTMAKRVMSATAKFSNGASTHLLKLPGLNQTKLLELLVLDDGEIEALNTGEEIRGITLDDVDCMSVSELRRALRKEKAEREAEVTKAKAAVAGELAAKDRVIADKAKCIAKLVEEKNRFECQTPDEQAAELERTLGAQVLLAIGSLKPISQAIQRFRAMPDAPHGLYVAAQNALDRMLAEVMAIATDHGIELNQLAAYDVDTYADPNNGESFEADDQDGLKA